MTPELSVQTAAQCFCKQNLSLFEGKVNTLMGRECTKSAAKQSKSRKSDCNRAQIESMIESMCARGRARVCVCVRARVPNRRTSLSADISNINRE
jgi:hypothetical protein